MHKLSKISKELKVSKTTLRNWHKKGIIKFHTVGGMNFITDEDRNKLLGIEPPIKDEETAIYCYVDNDDKETLKKQCDNLVNFAIESGYKINQVVTETGDKRHELESLFKEQKFKKLLIQDKDRLPIVAFNWIKLLLNVNGIEIKTLND